MAFYVVCTQQKVESLTALDKNMLRLNVNSDHLTFNN